MRAVIIGAGIAGLAAALRLSQIGWDSLIIERAPKRRSGGSALAVGGADRLGTELERHPGDIGAALSTWETALRPEVDKKQRHGRRVKGVYAPANPLLLWPISLARRRSALAICR